MCSEAVKNLAPALRALIAACVATGADTFIVHARKAWLEGLSPKENRDVPPLDYELVYAVKRENPALTIVLNGGIATLDQAEAHLAQVDGVMLGRAAYQSPALLAYFIWLQSYSLPTDAGALYADSDGDGMNNWQEWRCGTCPTNANSALRLLSPQRTGANVTVTWQSVAGVNYFLECSTNLSPAPLFTPLATGITGQPGTTSYTDTNAVGTGPLFYRVGVP